MEISQQPLPLQTDADGVVRVGGTRVPLDTVVIRFDQGATPEEIAQQFPVFSLEEVYAAVNYYLGDRAGVTAYMERRAEEAKRVREEDEARFGLRGVRERLLSRRGSQS